MRWVETTPFVPLGEKGFEIALARWYHRQRIRWQTWWTCGRHHAAPIDPFFVVDLPPDAIRYALSTQRRRALEAVTPPHVPAIVTGAWDLEATAVRETDRYRRTVGRLLDTRRQQGTANGEAPAVTADGGSPSSVGRVDRNRRDGRGRPGCAARPGEDDGRLPADELEWYLADLATRGCPRIDARRDGRSTILEAPTILDPRPWLPAAKGEIRVAVGRDGRWILHGGVERLAVAQLLGVETVPVHVYVRHGDWQRRRDRIVLTGSDGGTHPDLASLGQFSGTRGDAGDSADADSR